MPYKIHTLSVVIPVFNDQEVLPELIKRLMPAIVPLAENLQVILVDDGSRDRSWKLISELAEQYPQLQGLRLARNFGQQSAIAAGLAVSCGDIAVIMDSDLQDRPEDIHKLITALFEHNVNMAVAQWEQRKDSFFKLLLSRLFNLTANQITSIRIEPRLGGFRAIRRQVVEELLKFPEKTSTSFGLMYYIEQNYVCVPLNRDARFAGNSGYNLSKMLSLTLARILSFSMFPIRLLTFAGLSVSLLSLLAAFALIVRRLQGNVAPGWTSGIVLALFLFGINFAFLGILGEYIGKIYVEVKNRPKYIVATQCGKKQFASNDAP